MLEALVGRIMAQGRVVFSKEELEYIAKHFTDISRNTPENRIVTSIIGKAFAALGWKVAE